jgi:outer membrane protein OmpA-like peptidoglycan-associated protein
MKKHLLYILVLLSFNSLCQEIEDNPFKDAPLTFPIVIHYENVSANISHVSRLRLKVLAEYLQENPTFSIVIEGHVCCGPADRLSTKRARAVYKHLLNLEVNREQMSYIGKSFSEPIVKVEKNEQDKERNRRVEIELIVPSKR